MLHFKKNKRSSRGSQKVENNRAKCKSLTETAAPVESVFCGEKEKDLSKMLKKQKQSQKLRAAREYHTSFESPNMQHVEFFTEHWRKVTNLFGKTEILSD